MNSVLRLMVCLAICWLNSSCQAENDDHLSKSESDLLLVKADGSILLAGTPIAVDDLEDQLLKRVCSQPPLPLRIEIAEGVSRDRMMSVLGIAMDIIPPAVITEAGAEELSQRCVDQSFDEGAQNAVQ